MCAARAAHERAWLGVATPADVDDGRAVVPVAAGATARRVPRCAVVRFVVVFAVVAFLADVFLAVVFFAAVTRRPGDLLAAVALVAAVVLLAAAFFAVDFAVVLLAVVLLAVAFFVDLRVPPACCAIVPTSPIMPKGALRPMTGRHRSRSNLLTTWLDRPSP